MWGSNILTGQWIFHLYEFLQNWAENLALLLCSFSCSVLLCTCADRVSNWDKDWIRNQEWTMPSALISIKQWRLAADWTVSTGEQPEGWGKWLFSLTRHALDHMCNAVSSFGLSQDITELEWVQWKDIRMVRAWSAGAERRAWGSRACSSWRRDVLEEHNSSYPTPIRRLLRRWSHALYSGVYWENKR